MNLEEMLWWRENATDFVGMRWRQVEANTEVWLEMMRRFPEEVDEFVFCKKLPQAVLREMSKHSDWRVRYTVAMKNKTEGSILAALARDESEAIRKMVAGHKNTPLEIVKRLKIDPCDDVRDLARKRFRERSEAADAISENG